MKDSSAEHPENAFVPYLIPDETSTFFREVHFSNALSPTALISLGMVMDSREQQLENDPSLIIVMAVGSVTLLSMELLAEELAKA